MKKRYLALVVMAVVVLFGSRLQAAEADVAKDIEMLKQKIVELEQKLQEQKIAQQKYARKVAEEVHEEIEESLEERFGTLEIHGGAVLYYQGSQVHQLDGENADSPSGAGFTGDLELTWKPGVPLFENGEFYARVHAGKGTGADRGGNANNPVNVLLANLNTLAYDNSGEGVDTSLRLLEARYTQAFLDGMASTTGGKLKLEYFMDQNEFACSEKSQFVGKPFVNNSVFDSENEYAPVLGGTFKPAEFFALSLVAGSTSRPLLEDTPLADKQKSKYDNVFSPEYHLELYYRIAVTEHLAFSPDLQYVWNPGGDSNNDGIFAGMLRAEFNF